MAKKLPLPPAKFPSDKAEDDPNGLIDKVLDVIVTAILYFLPRLFRKWF